MLLFEIICENDCAAQFIPFHTIAYGTILLFLMNFLVDAYKCGHESVNEKCLYLFDDVIIAKAYQLVSLSCELRGFKIRLLQLIQDFNIF